MRITDTRPICVNADGGAQRWLRGRWIATLCFLILAAPAAPALSQSPQPQAGDSIRLGSSLVSFPVSVLDRAGKSVPNLSIENFEVFDQGVKREVEFFSTGEQAISLGMVLDMSSSMRGRSLKVQQAFQELIDYHRDGDEYFIVEFNKKPWLQVDFTSDFREVTGSVGLRSPEGTTALYDAVFVALEKIRHARLSRKAIIVLSDGQDNHSRYQYDEVRRIAEEAGATIYAVALPGIWGRDDELEVLGRRVMRDLAASTGGGFYMPNSADDLEKVFSSIGTEIRLQYQIAFTPSEGNLDGQWHQLKVRLVNLPASLRKVVVRSRPGYWAMR